MTAAAIALIAAFTSYTLVVSEFRSEVSAVEWPTFAVFAIALLWCERTPRTWIQLGQAGVVTPIWMFSFGLLLVGSSALAVCTAVAGATLHAVVQRHDAIRIIMRLGGVALSISTAGLILTGLGIRGSIMQFDVLPWHWALAIVATGGAILVVNGCISATAMSIRRQASLITLLRQGVTFRATAEGALLSLAPIWVIGLDFGLMIAPVLAVTTVLVFGSTRQALERSHEARHDSLTGLPNQRSFLEHMDLALRDQRRAVTPTTLVMDLDGFKEVNDRLGHHVGDALLVAFAERLVRSLPSAAVAARLGGDEFAVLLTQPRPGPELDQVVADLQTRLHEPLMIEGFPVSVTASIGSASAPQDGVTAGDLMRAADVAMYRAKRTQTSFEHHANCDDDAQLGRVDLLSDLGSALEHHELHIHFQPQLVIADGRIDTLEALIRWQHPDHGQVSPGEFIGLAEQTDLIRPITEMVLRVSTVGMMHCGITANLAVNVSARNLQDPGFANQVLDILQEVGFPPRRLELEITERSIVDNAERCRYTIERLRAAGIRIAIDDFGIGYSSFHTLRTVDVDRVKIDRDFIQGILVRQRDRLIVASVIELAHDLGLDVVAEGVESTQLWDAVAHLGCDVAQGYGIAMPMSYPDLRGWLS
ncbi:MAG: EAL domain-containing protein, partial [Ilumatobacter sp.]|nr:EAL domain-containing protein [Ilumatobacter sp.]